MFRDKDESEVVDRVCDGRAQGEPRANGMSGDRVSEWESIVGSIRAEKSALDAMNARVVDRVMSRIQYLEAPQSTLSGSARPRIASWKRSGALVAVCGLIMIAGMAGLQTFGRFASSSEPALETARVRSDGAAGAVHVNSVGDTRSLQQALEAVPEGSRVSLEAVELRGGFVFQKPMTIVSERGPTVIGRS